MDNQDQNKAQLQSCLFDMLTRIDSISILPKNKLFLCHGFFLSKLSLQITAAKLPTVWAIENLDSIAARFILQW